MTPPLLQVWLTSLAVDLARYFIVAGFAFVVFWVWGRERFRRRLVQGAYANAAKMLHDVRWSMSTVLVFSLNGAWVFYAGQAGVLRRYARIDEYGWTWFAISVLMLIVAQDTYFYWTHRAMHHPRLYRIVHRVHHVSTNPSPWTAYAFSPIEALVHALFVPLAWWLMPLHEGAVFIFMLFMVARNVLGHLSIELFPAGFATSRLGRWQTTTTHHALHHKYFTTNFGLYFTFWDKLMGTTEPRYERTFEDVVARTSTHVSAHGAAPVEAIGSRVSSSS